MKTREKMKYVNLIQTGEKRRKKSGKTKDRVVMFSGAVFIFVITFFIYGIMEETEPSLDKRIVRTGNRDILAQIDRLEEQKKIREEKEIKLKDEVFLGKNTPVETYAENLINDLKRMAERDESDQHNSDSGKKGVDLRNEDQTDNYFPDEIFSDLLKGKDIREESFEHGIPENKIETERRARTVKNRGVVSLFAFSNRIRSARIFNNGFDNIVNHASDSGRNLSGIKKGYSSPNTFRIVYNSNPVFKIFEGDFIEAVLANKIVNNREASPVIAMVSRDLLDKNGEFVLIPSGSRFIGKAKKISSQQDRRLMIKFHRLILPNGRSVFLGEENKRFSALDSNGSVGIKGKKNSHTLARFGSALLFGSLNGLSGFAQSKTDQTSGLSHFLNRTSDNFEMLNGRLAADSLSVMPTITVNSGTELKIYVSVDIEISAYSKISERSYYGR